MCLIIHSPNATLPPRIRFAEAAEQNPDGIGVMSLDGIAKFLGKRKTRRAWRYVSQLAAAGIPYAVHFRWATHGRVNRSNCHPFEIPGTGAYLMHNGILWTSHFATDDHSDTRIFADDIAPGYLTEKTGRDLLTALGMEAAGNRLLIMQPDGTMLRINPHLWTTLDGICYSNTYSFTMPSSGKGRAGAGYISRAYASGPAVNYGEDDDWTGWHDADDREATESAASEIVLQDPGSWSAWEAEYKSRQDQGYTDAEAEDLANEFIVRELNRKQSAPALAEYRNPYRASYEAKRSGFDWHDSSTWTKYPIPGSREQRVLARHDDADDYTAPDARDMFI